MVKISLPLHRQLKNVYRQKISYQDEIKRLKEELKPFKEKIEKINLDMLAHVDTRRSTRKR
jgi:peptidoglycan hydrolase CwlO-like protein